MPLPLLLHRLAEASGESWICITPFTFTNGAFAGLFSSSSSSLSSPTFTFLITTNTKGTHTKNPRQIQQPIILILIKSLRKKKQNTCFDGFGGNFFQAIRPTQRKIITVMCWWFDGADPLQSIRSSQDCGLVNSFRPFLSLPFRRRRS